MTDSAFSPNNLHLESLDLFRQADPHLRRLAKQRLVHRSSLLDQLPRREPGIYTIGGGRQVGKTTLLKQWMLELLESGLPPEAMFFLTGELIDDHHVLVRTVSEVVASFPAGHPGILILDEVSYIRDWDKGIKFLADSGVFEEVVLILTGSDLSFIREARMRFPGRRGKADVCDFHLQPLSFRESVELKARLAPAAWAAVDAGSPDEETVEILFQAFDDYLKHGGYLTAINDMMAVGRILPATFATYSDWIRGDMLKRGKREPALRELLGMLLRQLGSQTTWHSLAAGTTIEHHATVADYVDSLTAMEAVFVVPALQEHSLSAAPKKARKVFFRDPFIQHAIRAWLEPSRDPFSTMADRLANDPESSSSLAEAVATAHFARHYPTFYIKGDGEVDVAYLDNGRFWPVEIKWTRQIRLAELKQLRKYPNAVLLGKKRTTGEIDGIVYEPLPVKLARL